jgi:hypothetical protein
MSAPPSCGPCAPAPCLPGVAGRRGAPAPRAAPAPRVPLGAGAARVAASAAEVAQHSLCGLNAYAYKNHCAGVRRGPVGCQERAARLVGEGADDGAEDHGRAKARDEQAADVPAVKAVVLVERVHVRALQPVARCARTLRSARARRRRGARALLGACERAPRARDPRLGGTLAAESDAGRQPAWCAARRKHERRRPAGAPIMSAYTVT